jgi:predicted O-methyltransferase YrrM
MSGFASSLRRLVRRDLPSSNPKVIATIRRVRNLRMLPLAIDPRKRQQLLAAFRRCQSFQDYFDFARDWLHGGAVQDPEEIRAAIDYIRMERPRCICEIGTANGGTNLLLSHTLESVETIIGIDLYVMNAACLRLLLRPGQRIHLINGSSSAPRTFARVRAALGGDKIDMLFIDGDHRYDAVKRDFVLYSQLVRDGGLIMFHDIVPDHRSRYGRPTPRFAGDVPQFWNQLKPHYRHREFIRDPDQDALGLGILHWSESVKVPQL